MFDSVKDINLAALRDNYERLYFFGLGFIQLKINDRYRLHFYNQELPSITEDVHNHRYDFTSKVLLGEITNYFYDVTEGDSYVMDNESCSAEHEAPKIAKPCNAILKKVVTYKAGSSYNVTTDMFHRVEATDCITLLDRGPKTKEFAQVVIPKGKMAVCPFSKKIDPEFLWELMEQMVSNA